MLTLFLSTVIHMHAFLGLGIPHGGRVAVASGVVTEYALLQLRLRLVTGRFRELPPASGGVPVSAFRTFLLTFGEKLLWIKEERIVECCGVAMQVCIFRISQKYFRKPRFMLLFLKQNMFLKDENKRRLF